MKVLVSACLFGENCKYDGGNNQDLKIINTLLAEGIDPVVICPEVAGGLPIPRTPAELQGDKVINQDGEDVTEQFMAGARAAVELAKKHGCKAAVLKANSPSCGCGKIYDGTFSGKLVDGYGVTARLLRKSGVVVYTEETYKKMLIDFMFED
ncbi:MAG: DUF523 domain-containing protein [Oscillospiraceae bacterium]|nr:DUF523 domain-containing protein [Oscillospiraceae bacterium]